MPMSPALQRIIDADLEKAQPCFAIVAAAVAAAAEDHVDPQVLAETLADAGGHMLARVVGADLAAGHLENLAARIRERRAKGLSH